jgi:hypothetical protein
MPPHIITLAEQQAGMDIVELATRFVSLGATCELGYVQRYLGAEPLDLLRWSSVRVEDVTRAFNAGFAGLGERIEVMGGSNPHQEWTARDLQYKIAFHTGRHADEVDRATIEAEMRRRLAWQRERLLADLASGEKIFVRWPARGETLDETAVHLLAEAIGRNGPAKLLVVSDGWSRPAARVGPALIRASVWRLAPADMQTAVDLDGWLRVMVTALQAVKGDWGQGNTGQGDRTAADPLGQLVEAEREAVDAAREAPYDAAVLHHALNMLRKNGKLAELDMLYDAAPRATQCDAGVISVWCSVPRIQRNGPEMIRRAEEMLRLHPGDVKARSHMIFAQHATKGYGEAIRQAEIWMAEFPDDHNIIGPAATIALASDQWSVSEQLWRRMDKIHPGGLDAGMWRMFVIALRRQGKDEEAAQAFDEARRKYPDSPVFADL